VNDSQQAALWRRGDIRDHLPILDDSDFGGLPSATDSSAGLVDLRFIGSTLRRGMRVWLITAAIGLVAGGWLVTQYEQKHSAITTVLVDTGNSGQGQSGETNEAAIAQSVPVAAAVVAQLGLQQTPASFLGSYTVTNITPSILRITASGPTDSGAVQRASAIANQFLAYRANYLQQQLQQTAISLNQQFSQAEQHLNSIDAQVKTVEAEARSPSQQANLNRLEKQQTDAQDIVGSTTSDVQNTLLQARTLTTQMVQGSQVLSPASPVKRSVKTTLVLYTGGGLLAGLVIGMAIVVIGGITTDKLRRRDDIAIASGAPVKLSVGRLRGRAARRGSNMKRVVEHLRNAVPQNSRGKAGLAVVAVDDAPTVARAVVKLAVASSQQRRRVVIADLSTGAPAARQLGATGPGISTVSPKGVPIVVVVPESSDVAPVGPLGTPPPGLPQMSQQLADICAHADLVLSIVTLDPSFVGEYLGTWATDAVLVVTAGQSTSVRIHAASEMIRLAGTRLGSVVLLDADRDDESLGTVTADYRPSSSMNA
jgi:capsular polysaccharide biosynthesis protein